MDLNKKTPFIIALSYLTSFLLVRLFVIILGSANSEIAGVVEQGMGPHFYIGRNLILFGHHIHHFYFGFILISFAGWSAIVGSPKIGKEKLAVLFGAGLGLFMDEIGLLLTWGDYYSSLSYLVGVFFLGVFLAIIYFPSFWRKVK